MVTENRSARLQNGFLLTGHFFLSNFFLLVSIVLLGLLCSVKITAYHYPISILLSLVYTYWVNSILSESISLRTLGILAFSWILTVLILMYGLQFIYDISWDGTEYHQQAIIELKNGWNPLTSPFKGIRSHDIFVFSYAKASWLAQAALYAFSGNIQTAKVLHFTMMFSASGFVVWLLFSLKNISPKVIAVLAFMVAFNPITTSQFFSFYLDGILYSCMVCMVVLLIGFFREEKKLLYFPGIFFCIHLISTLKFTGLIYAGVLSFFFILAYLLQKKYQKVLQLSVLFFGMHISVLFTSGYNPYLTNTLSYHHPFYPINKMTIPACSQIPANFCDHNRVYTFVYSIFSRTKNIQSPEDATLKIPFTYTVAEVSGHPLADARTGGFGVWFSGLIVLSLLLLYDIFRGEKWKLFSALFWLSYLMVALLLLVLINPHPWWARYVPLFYLFPFLIVVYSYMYRTTKFAKSTRTLLLVALVVNFYLTLEGTLRKNLPASASIREQVQEIKDSGKLVVLCSNGLSPVIRLTDQDIQVSLVDKESLSCKEPQKLKKVLDCQVGEYCLE